LKRMRLKTLIVSLALAFIVLGCYGKDCLTKKTTNPDHLKQLLETN
jgi:hypothetical protein